MEIDFGLGSFVFFKFMTIKSGLRSEFLRKMSSGLLSGCLQNQI
jgi:hypothetical protein